MPRKGENIYKRKDGRWEGRYIKARSEKGKAIYGYVYATSYKEVRKKRSLAVANIPSVSSEQMSDQQTSLSFTQLCDNWLISVKPQLKESSYIKYRNLLHTYIFPELSDISLEQITSARLHFFCEKLLNCGGASQKGLSSKTVSDILSLIRNIIHFAEMLGFYIPCTGKEITIRQSASELTVLSRSDQDCLCQYLYSHLSERSLGILLCLFTGIRIGELCALKWEDISFSEKTVYIHQTMQRIQLLNTDTQKTSVIITAPKSKCSVRMIPLPENLINLIQKNFPDRHGFFLTGETSSYVEPRTMQNFFKEIQIQCGISPVNFHALRHTFATRCVELGFDVKSLSEILGHASVNITMNRYVHPSMELKQENMQKLSLLLAVK